ncbi:hypothetical protein VB264_07860 [Arcicella aquatica]|uniref:Ig-like domain-containing protein n=1 Tax=Arcicella aquatica TaxID=217141 RepID=A0ABU5QLN4_9BACT|nr:hypothetical protein [Arcicella aquatica]MEA5257695.1 hypothetical protein [Arcicella aquatica]
MRKHIILNTIILIVMAFAAVAQTSKPKHYTDSTSGKLYWNKKLPVYIWVSTTPDHAEKLLNKSPNQKYSFPFYLDTEGVNYIRSKNAIDPETRVAVEPPQEVRLEIYADGIAPETGISLFNGSKKYVNAEGKIFYGPFVSFSLSANDKTSGVETVFYAINNTSFEAYKSEKKIATQGNYVLKYYATDNVGNASTMQQETFTVDNTPPFTNLTVNGVTDDKVISFTSRLYFNTEDSISGLKGTYYKFDDGAIQPYDGKSIPFSVLSEGKHTLYYYSTDNVNNQEKERKFDFFLDKSSPLMATDILGDRFIANNTVYFSGKTKLKLTAIDNKVGIKEVKYSIDNQPFVNYNNPFYLPSISGMHNIRYYSVDNLNNQTTSLNGAGYEEFKHNISKVYVDLTGPNLQHEIIGDIVTRRDTMLLGPNNFIQLKANDPESGLQKITYNFDGKLIENDYTKPIKMTEKGVHKFDYYGYDNVNNRNFASFVFVSDIEGPELFTFWTVGSINTTKQGIDIYPSTVGFTLAGTDVLAGLKSITYSINGQAPKVYLNTIGGFKANTKYTVKITGTDYLGNQSFKEVTFMTGK